MNFNFNHFKCCFYLLHLLVNVPDKKKGEKRKKKNLFVSVTMYHFQMLIHIVEPVSTYDKIAYIFKEFDLLGYFYRGLLNDYLYAETFSRSRWFSLSWGPSRIKQVS